MFRSRAFCPQHACRIGGIDLLMLVVAADESVMPQTREHFDICRLLNITSGVVVITKSDLADADMLSLVRHGNRGIGER